MEKETEIHKTTIYIERPLWEATQFKLIPARMSLTALVDKMLRKYVGWSPKFSYPEETVEPEPERKAK